MNKKNISLTADNTALKLKVTADKKESVRRKLVVTAEKKENVRRKLVVTAKEKESVRNKLAVTARQLAVTAREKESVRRKLAVTARQLAVTAREKESVRSKLAATARQLAVVAKEKESVRRKLAITAEKLHLKAKKLAATADEKESVRRKLAVIARKLAIAAKEKESVRNKLVITARQLAVTAKEKEVVRRKLLVSEIQYRKLFETAKDGVLLIDPATEKIVDANPFLLELMGYSLSEIIGKKLWEIGAVPDIKYAKMMFEELQTKGYVRYDDLPIKSKDGLEHQVEFVSNRYPLADGTEMIQSNIRDISDRKFAEKKAAAYLEGLEKLNKMMTGRELKMIELKEEIAQLKAKTGTPGQI